MVFVRVHLMKGRLSAAQKDELGAKLVQEVADAEGLVNNEKNKEVSWVQFYEFEPENWYAPATLAAPAPTPGSSSTSSSRRNSSAHPKKPARWWAKPPRPCDRYLAPACCQRTGRGCTSTSSRSTSLRWTAAYPTGKASAPT
jgi:phenylpyruvate tautomerase PptA (4-oxalocrotonate tautomerase family)